MPNTYPKYAAMTLESTNEEIEAIKAKWATSDCNQVYDILTRWSIMIAMGMHPYNPEVHDYIMPDGSLSRGGPEGHINWDCYHKWPLLSATSLTVKEYQAVWDMLKNPSFGRTCDYCDKLIQHGAGVMPLDDGATGFYCNNECAEANAVYNVAIANKALAG